MSRPAGSPDGGDGEDDGDRDPSDPSAEDEEPESLRERVRRLWDTDDDRIRLAKDVLISLAAVALVGILLFAVSGVWPPLVAVESGSMEPNMQRGDLVFLVDEDRFTGDGAVEGVVTRAAANDYSQFGEHGDVIIFRPNGNPDRTPVIHRAHFWVERGENWIDRYADSRYVGDASCADLATCPAPHDGFITKGDANPSYDQHEGGARTDVVKPAWVTGKALLRIPWLGHVRLTVDRVFGVVVLGAAGLLVTTARTGTG